MTSPASTSGAASDVFCTVSTGSTMTRLRGGDPQETMPEVHDHEAEPSIFWPLVKVAKVLEKAIVYTRVTFSATALLRSVSVTVPQFHSKCVGEIVAAVVANEFDDVRAVGFDEVTELVATNSRPAVDHTTSNNTLGDVPSGTSTVCVSVMRSPTAIGVR